MNQVVEIPLQTGWDDKQVPTNPFNPFPYQVTAIQWLLSHPRGIFALDQGLGKTVCALKAIEKSGLKSLVICPASVKMVWAEETEKWTNLSYQVLNTKLDFDRTKDITIINYDIAAKMAPKLPGHWGVVVLDESHFVKNPKAKRTRAALQWVSFARYCWALSGTPIPNRPVEIYALLKRMNILRMDYREFGYRYCAAWETPWDTFDVSGHSNLDELRGRMEPFTLRIMKETVLKDLPPKSYQVIALDLPISTKEKKLNIETLKGARKPQDIAGLPEILQDHGLTKVPAALEHILNLLREHEKVLIFAHHRSVISNLQIGLSEEKIETWTLTGSHTQKQRKESVDAFQKGSGRVLIANMQAGKVGLTLTAAYTVVFVESSWSPETIFQAVDRVHRIGQDRPVLAQFLTINQSIDEYQLRRALEKIEVTSQLIKETNLMDERFLVAMESIATSLELIADGQGKGKRTRRTKEEIAADKAAKEGNAAPQGEAPATEPSGNPTTESVPDTSTGEKEITTDTLRDALVSVRKAVGMDAAKKLLSDFKVAKISDVSADKYPEFIQACEDATLLG
jgi:SWI/SNF-related matrix-associated actin-dependent regulator of chromatin subfamily A-like protein 1